MVEKCSRSKAVIDREVSVTRVMKRRMLGHLCGLHEVLTFFLCSDVIKRIGLILVHPDCDLEWL